MRRDAARARLGLAALVTLAVAAAGCVSDRPGPAGPGDTSGEQVRIRGFAFVPRELTIPVGTPVVWTNEDGVLHTVTAEDGSFDSSTFGEGRTFRLTPDRAGTFPYICAVHPFMHGTLRVTN